MKGVIIYSIKLHNMKCNEMNGVPPRSKDRLRLPPPHDNSNCSKRLR